MDGIIPFFFNSTVPDGTYKVKNSKFNSHDLEQTLNKLLNKKGYKINMSKYNEAYNIQQHKVDAYNTNTNNNTQKNLIHDTEAFKKIPLLHNNMVPFFGGTIKQNTKIDQRNDLDFYTGNIKVDQLHKHEIPTLFTPSTDQMVEAIDPREYDRFPLLKRSNEIPFEQKHVGPGLNDGYTDKPSGGYHNPLRILPKTSEELYVNPKETYKGRIIRGKHMVSKGIARQNVYKYTPELLVKNENGERNFVTTGQIIAPMQQPEVIQPNVNQYIKSPNIGPAISIVSGQNNKRSTHKKSEKPTLLGMILGKFKSIGPTDVNNQPARSTNRQTYEGNNYVGGAKSNVSAQMSTHIDQQPNTGRESIEHITQSGNINNQQMRGSVVYDPKQLTSTTGRQLIEGNTHDGNINTQQIRGSVVYDPDQLTSATGRQLIEGNTHDGNINTQQMRGSVAYDPNQLTSTTGRQLIEGNKYDGNINTQQIRGSIVYDPNQLTSTTGRQLIEGNTHDGNINNQQIRGSVVYDPNQLTSTTGRQLIEGNTHDGNINTQQIRGSVVYDPNQLTSTTGRQLIEGNTHDGNINTQQTRGSIVYDPDQLTGMTGRQLIEINNFDGNINTQQTRGSVVYDPNQLTQTTGRQLIEINDYDGNINTQQTRGSVVYDPNQLTSTTGRQLIEGNKYDGNINTQQTRGSVAYDPDQLTSTTGRQLIETNNYDGHVNTNRGSVAYDPYDVPIFTGREIIGENNNNGSIQPSVGIGYGYKTSPKDIKSTGRQTYSDTMNISPAGPFYGVSELPNYLPFYMVPQNVNKELLSKNRAQENPKKPTINIGSDSFKLLCKDNELESRSPCASVISTATARSTPVLAKKKYQAGIVNSRFDPSLINHTRNNPLNININ